MYQKRNNEIVILSLYSDNYAKQLYLREISRLAKIPLKTTQNLLSNLEKKRIISKKLTDKIIEMKGFRNILVHRYGDINDKQAFETIKENLDDFVSFKKEILKILK